MERNVTNGVFDTVGLSEDGRKLVILDQTLLPGKVEFLELDELMEIRATSWRSMNKS